MPLFLQYLFKLSLTLAVLYLFYYALLRNLTFYTWNRFYLLCYSLIAFIIPFINITPWIKDQPAGSLIKQVNFISKLSPVSAILPAEQASTFSFYDLTLLLFTGGAVTMLARLLLQFLSIQSIKRKATLVQSANIRLYDVDSPISPFSFARSIFINTRRHSEEDLQKIIQHEFVHVKQQHTADLLVSELLCIANWYNPFAWLIRKAIRQNLEFIADHSVLQSGLDAKQYQYLLLQVTGLTQYSLSNNFSISSLKQRIFMMNKLKSARAHLLKFLFLLPLLAVTLLAFRSQQQQRKQQNQLLQNQALLHDTVPPKPPLPPTVIAKPTPVAPPAPPAPPPPPPIPRAVKSIFMDAETNKATVVLKNGKKEVYDLTNHLERVAYEKKYSLLPPPPPPPPVPALSPDIVVIGKKIVKKPTTPVPPTSPVIVDVDLVTPIAPVLVDVDLSDTTLRQKLYKDKEDTYKKKEKKYQDQEKIYQDKENIYKQKEKKYQDQEKIYQDKENIYKKKEDTYITADSLKFNEGSITMKGSLNVSHKIASPDALPYMYIVNGVVSSQADFSNINPQQIESITILKGADATRLYGEKAVNGVVAVSTKRGQITGDTGNVSFLVMNDINSLNKYKGLVVINGKEASKADVEGMLAAFRKAPFTFTLEMIMMKREEAVRKWGDKGKDGAMIVNFQPKNQ